MPELRSGARRGRAAPANQRVQAEGPAAGGTARRGTVARNRRGANENKATGTAEAKEEIKFIAERGEFLGGEGKGEREHKEGVGERRMDDYDSGAKSAEKPPGAEDEGGTTPIPDKVIHAQL